MKIVAHLIFEGDCLDNLNCHEDYVNDFCDESDSCVFYGGYFEEVYE